LIHVSKSPQKNIEFYVVTALVAIHQMLLAHLLKELASHTKQSRNHTREGEHYFRYWMVYMYVKGVRINNFRSLKSIDITLSPGLNVLVGKNNAGKSNIIRALDYVLGEKWPTYRDFEHKDFFKESEEVEPSDAFQISVWLDGKGINEEILRSENKQVTVYEIRQSLSWNDPKYFLELEIDGHRDHRDWKTYSELGQAICNADKVVLLLAVPRDGKKMNVNSGYCIERIIDGIACKTLALSYVRPYLRQPIYLHSVTLETS
jgi:AAA ATPase-like protein